MHVLYIYLHKKKLSNMLIKAAYMIGLSPTTKNILIDKELHWGYFFRLESHMQFFVEVFDAVF